MDTEFAFSNFNPEINLREFLRTLILDRLTAAQGRDEAYGSGGASAIWPGRRKGYVSNFTTRRLVARQKYSRE